MWPRQILELGKKFDLMIRFQNLLKASFHDVWKTFLQTSWRRFEDVLKASWSCLEDVFARRLEDVLARRLEDVWPRRIYWSRSKRLEDVFWRRMTKANIFVLIKTSSEDEDERRLHQDECFQGLNHYNHINLTLTLRF